MKREIKDEFQGEIRGDDQSDTVSCPSPNKQMAWRYAMTFAPDGDVHVHDSEFGIVEARPM